LAPLLAALIDFPGSQLEQPLPHPLGSAAQKAGPLGSRHARPRTERLFGRGNGLIDVLALGERKGTDNARFFRWVSRLAALGRIDFLAVNMQREGTFVESTTHGGQRGLHRGAVLWKREINGGLVGECGDHKGSKLSPNVSATA